MEHGDAGLGQGAGDDEGLAEGAASAPAEGQEDALEEGGRLEEGLLEDHVQVEVEALVLGYIVSDAREEDQVVEVLGHGRAQVGGEDLGGLKHGRRRPVFGLGEAQDLLPVAQGRDDLEGLGEFHRAVLGENLGDHLYFSSMWGAAEVGRSPYEKFFPNSCVISVPFFVEHY